MIHVTNVKKCICALLLLLTTTFCNRTHPITRDHMLMGVIVTGAGYIALNVYGQWLYNHAHAYYAPVRAHMPITYEQLLVIILQEYDRWYSTNRNTTSPYKNYPLVWYVALLEDALRDIRYARTFNLGISSLECDSLLSDLSTLRKTLVYQYDYIKERRSFDNRWRLVS